MPTFFRNVIGPAIAVVIVMGLFALGLPYSAPIAVTGAIMIFLPGGALAAGMRDLIDGSIVSGTARLSEAILLGAAVGIGISVGLGIAALWGPTIEFELPSFEPFTIATQAAAAAVACAALALHNGVPTRFVLSIALVGAGGLVIDRVARASAIDPILATGMAAAFIGGAGRWLASRNRASASIWIAAAALPILPGRLLVEGLLQAPEGGGSVELLTALLVGFAIGIGAALGDVVVATVRRFNRSVVQPVVIAPAIGLVEGGLTWVAQGGHATKRQARPPETVRTTPPARARRLSSAQDPNQRPHADVAAEVLDGHRQRERPVRPLRGDGARQVRPALHPQRILERRGDQRRRRSGEGGVQPEHDLFEPGVLLDAGCRQEPRAELRQSLRVGLDARTRPGRPGPSR